MSKKRKIAEELINWLNQNCSHEDEAVLLGQGEAYVMGTYLTDKKASREIAKMAVTRILLIRQGRIPPSKQTDGELKTGYEKPVKELTDRDMKAGWGDVPMVEED